MKKYYQYIVLFIIVLLSYDSNSQNLNRSKEQNNSSRPIETFIASYDFNGNANDSTSNGFDGTLVGDMVPVSDRFGNPGSAYDFTNGSIQTVLKSQPDGISLWFKTSDGGNLLNWGFDEDFFFQFGYEISVTSVGIEMRYAIPDGSNAPSGSMVTLERSDLLNNQWRHLLININQTDGFIYFYIDGAFNGEFPINSNGITWNANSFSEGMEIGSNFLGEIDDLQLVTGQVSDQEILERYYQFGWPYVNDALISSYDFSGDALDVSGNGFSGNSIGAVLTNDRFGVPDAAFSFDGVDDRIEIYPVPTFENTSLSVWFKTSSDYSAGYVPIVDITGIGAVAIGANNRLEGTLFLGENFVVLSSSVEVNDGVWHHAVMSFDGNVFNLYLDNQLVDSFTDFSGSINVVDNPTFLDVGFIFSEGRFFNGDIDDINYYNYGISRTDVSLLYGMNSWPSTTPIAAYDFTGNANDLSGNNLNGIVFDATLSQNRFGEADQAYSFNGTSAYIAVATDEVFSIGQSTDLAVSGWFNTSAASGVLYDKSDGNTGYLAFYSNNSLIFYATQGTAESQVSISGFNDGNWHHFVTQMDRDGGMQIYIDGVLEAENVNALSNGFNPDTAEDFLIGVAGGVGNSGLNTYFNGQLDDIKVYNQLLAADEIGRQYSFGPWPTIGQVQIVRNQSNNSEGLSLYFSDDSDKYGNAFEMGDGNLNFILNGNIDTPYGDDNLDGIIDLFGEPIITPSGLNYVVLVEANRSYQIEPITTVGFLGSARTGDDTGWNGADTDMDYIGGGVFELKNIELFDGEWKIRANDDWLLANWGANPEDPGVLVNFGPNIAVSAGTYDIAVDVINKSYTITEASVNQSLVAEYYFSSSFDDTSDNINNGTGNSVTFIDDRFGNTGSAAFFNGTNGYINIPDATELNWGTSQDIVISGWFRTANGGVLFDKSNGSSGFFGVVEETGEIRFFMVETSSSTTTAEITTNGTYNDGAWHHYVIQITRASKMEIWVDGEVDSENEIATDGINPDMTEDLLIGVAAGVDNAGLNLFFDGAQDDIRFFNQVLTLEEVTQLYTEGGWPIVSPPRLNSFTPARAEIGDVVTVFGNHFSSSLSGNIVDFNGIRADVISASANELQVEVPLGASYGPINIATNGLTASSTKDFSVTFEGNGLNFDTLSFIEDGPVEGLLGLAQGSMITGDFDQDGNLDVGVISQGSQLAIFRNISAIDGEIVFDTPISFTVNSDIGFISTADLDGDGKMDMAVAEGLTVSVFINKSTGAGDINFTKDYEFTLSSTSIRDIEIADMNGDGRKDILVKEMFPPESEFSFFNTFTVTTFANISEEGILDFSVVDRTSVLGFFGFKLKDVNNDGKPDYISTGPEILLNTGNFQENTFGFSSSFDFTPIGSAQVDLTTGDFNNNDKIDFALTEDNGGRVIGIYSNATVNPLSGLVNFLEPVTFESGGAPPAIASADLDGDGLIDIVGTDLVESSISLYRNSTAQAGDFSLESRFDMGISFGGYDLQVGDFNNDGKVDILTTGFDQGIAILRNNLQSADEINVPENQPTNLAFSDVTSSKITISYDAAANHNGSYLVLRNSSSTPEFIPENGKNYQIGDLVGDDLVVYVGAGTTFIDSLLNQNTRYYYSLFAFNGSGNISSFLTSNPLTGDEMTLVIDGLSTEPTDQPTDFSVTDFDETNRLFNVNYTAPATSVDGYLVVRRLNSKPVFVPSDGQVYQQGDGFNADSIVYVGSATQFTESGIVSNSSYHYLVYSYNGSEASINYLQNAPLSGSFNVPSAEPAAQPTNFTVNSLGPNSVSFSFTAAPNVAGYLILRNDNQSPSSSPEDFIRYQYGDQIDNDVVVYRGSATSIIDNNLNPQTQYFYAIFAYNGSGDLINYLVTSPLAGNLTTSTLPNLAAQPQAQPNGFEVLSKTTTTANLGFTSSDASGYLIVRSRLSNFFFTPADGITYGINSRVGNATISYIGTESSWSENNLSSFTNYFYKVFAFNGTGNQINYLQSSPLLGELVTLTNAPSTQASDFSVTEQTFDSFTFSFSGNLDEAEGYLIARKEGENPPSSVPMGGISYVEGDLLAEGEEVVSIGTEQTFQETALTIGDTYSYAIYSYNGEGQHINYNISNPLTGTATTLVDNSAPSIQNIQYSEEVELGAPVSISVTVTDQESGVEEVAIQYIVPGATNFENATVQAMEGSENEYTYQLPAVGAAGFEFRIFAKNIAQLDDVSAIQSVTVVFPDEGLAIPYNSFGNTQEDYRIVSVPLTLDNSTVNGVFGSQLGEYGDLSKWRMFRYSNETTSEMTGSSNLIPGRGYWLIVNDNDVSFNTGSGKNVPASVDQPYEIVLSPGWNQIGNPYPYDVSWSDIQEFNNEDFELRIFNGSFSDGNTLSAFSGGFVNWPNSSDFTLRIPKTPPTGSDNRKSFDKGQGWEMNLVLENGNVRNELTGIGMHENASNELDSKDQFNLPHFLNYIDLNHPIKTNGYHVAKNIVRLQDQYNWNFDIKSNLNVKETILSWELPSSSIFNNSSELFLWDPSSQNLVDMKKSNQYQLRNSKGRDLKIIYGSMDYVNSVINLSSFHVNDPYPNPTNGVVNLSYFVPKGEANSTMTLELYNLNGSLVNQKQIAIGHSGFQSSSWNINLGTEEELLGVYLLRVRNGVSSINKKIIIR